MTMTNEEIYEDIVYGEREQPLSDFLAQFKHFPLDATVNISCYEGYSDELTTTITVNYIREEMDSEATEREKKLARIQRERRWQYEQLRKEFGEGE